jgi:hypothetical protein
VKADILGECTVQMAVEQVANARQVLLGEVFQASYTIKVDGLFPLAAVDGFLI